MMGCWLLAAGCCAKPRKSNLFVLGFAACARLLAARRPVACGLWLVVCWLLAWAWA
jgi:hypothetical protein